MACPISCRPWMCRYRDPAHPQDHRQYGFTETFFTDARIPADCLMGEEGQGWKIAMQTLQYERGAGPVPRVA